MDVLKIEKLLEDLKQFLLSLDEKKANLVFNSFRNNKNLLKREESFNSIYVKSHKRGEVVHVDFGLNAGSEFGGPHYGVVLKTSKKGDNIINVIPLKSATNKIDATERKLNNKYEFSLGEIKGLKGESIAIVNQIRPTSKMRIIKPLKVSEPCILLNEEQLDILDNSIVKYYTNFSVNSVQKPDIKIDFLSLENVQKNQNSTYDNGVKN